MVNYSPNRPARQSSGAATVAEDPDRAIAAVAGRQHGNITRAQLHGIGLNDNAIAYRTVRGDRRPRAIRAHRSDALTRRDVRTHLGIRVTSPARTLLDCAPRLDDKALTRALNDARLSGFLHPSELAAALDGCPGRPGTGRVRSLIATGSNPTRSELEDAFLAFCERFGLPRPLVNTKVAGFEVDALFEAERLAVELDGYAFHSSHGAFERDRDRDAAMLAIGIATVRITWERVATAPVKEAARLESILRARLADAA